MTQNDIMGIPSPLEARSQALSKHFSSSVFPFLIAIFLPTVTATIRIGCVDQVCAEGLGDFPHRSISWDVHAVACDHLSPLHLGSFEKEKVLEAGGG